MDQGSTVTTGAGSARWPAIAKDVAALPVQPHLLDYGAACRDFTWDQARQALAGLPGGRGLNIAYEAVDRHVAEGRGSTEALRFVEADGGVRSLSYGNLAEQSGRFAAVLRALGVGRGERVFSLLGRSPELYVAVLGTFRNGSVFCPLFSAFGPEPVRQRLHLGTGRVLVTTKALYRKKVAPVRDALPELRHVLLVDADGSPEPGTLDLAQLLSQSPPPDDRGPGEDIADTQPEDMALLHFTSGTTGTPKGAIHVHDAVAAHYATGRFALDLHPGDIYWCTADPGWVTGMSYGIIAPLVHGVTAIVDEEELDADRWYRILAEQHVTVWYTAPTALRMLMKAGAERAAGHDLSALRFIASVGEPLNPEAVVWGRDVLGLPVHDNWWQTETGGIMIANYAAMDIRPGSMGRPLPGIGRPIEPGRISEATKLAIMMPPVSVCHQLSCTGRPQASWPQTTTSGLSGSPTLATNRSAERSWARATSLPARISIRSAVGAVYQTVTRCSARMRYQRSASISSSSTTAVTPCSRGAMTP